MGFFCKGLRFLKKQRFFIRTWNFESAVHVAKLLETDRLVLDIIYSLLSTSKQISIQSYFVGDTEDCSRLLLWNADFFVFMLLLFCC